jgi:5'-phosphate synthase pdxT subunit
VAHARVGILGYQGCIEPHEEIFRKLGVACLRVKTPSDLKLVDRLILPGGESTTMLRFLKLYNMIEPLREFAKRHRVWGICAGAILLAAEVKNPKQESLGLIDITAHRNFYGSQLDSFTTKLKIDLCTEPVEAQFIRAPLLTELSEASSGASTAKKIAHSNSNPHPLKIRAELNGQPVFFSQGEIWACSFHVELGSDLSLHRAFLLS